MINLEEALQQAMAGGVHGTLPPAWVEDDLWLQLYPAVAPPAPPMSPPPARRQRRPSVRSLKADVLAQLDKYLVYARRLKRWDPEGYAMFRRVGMFVPPADAVADRRELEVPFEQLPSFGAVALGLALDTEGDRIPSRFVYFRKLKRPGADIERVSGGAVYRLHTYWDDAKDEKLNKLRGYGIGLDYAVHVAPDGRVRALRMRQPMDQFIETKRHRKRRLKKINGYGGGWDGGNFYVLQDRWQLPKVDVPRAERAQRIVLIFRVVMNFWLGAARGSVIRVTASKDGLVMPFVVDVLQTPQFFDDREPVIIDGKKKRIFHIVRPHARRTASGVKGVRTYFAGLRRFRWNGYDIAISVPGREHSDVADFRLGAFEDLPEHRIIPGKYVDMPAMAEIVANAIGAPEVAP